MGNGLSTTGKWTFSDCPKLESIVIPDNIELIDENAFYNCISLKKVAIGNGVISIRKEAFKNCKALEEIETNNVRSIGESAFYSCDKLKSIHIGKALQSIRDYAFLGCYNLENIYIEDLKSWCSISYMNTSSSPTNYAHRIYYNDEEIQKLVLPNGLETITLWAFRQCESITSVIIPNSVKIVGQGAFSGCSNLSTIKIGEGIEQFESYCFSSCENIKDVYCFGSYPARQAGYQMFKDSYIEYATLHVPEGSIDNYKNWTPWSQFGSIVALTAKDTRINTIDINDSCNYVSVYSIDGSSTTNLKHGLNIVKMVDGTYKKIIKR